MWIIRLWWSGEWGGVDEITGNVLFPHMPIQAELFMFDVEVHPV